jgi:hypothetical protein
MTSQTWLCLRCTQAPSLIGAAGIAGGGETTEVKYSTKLWG